MAYKGPPLSDRVTRSDRDYTAGLMDMGDGFCPVWGSMESSFIFKARHLNYPPHGLLISRLFQRAESSPQKTNPTRKPHMFFFLASQNFLFRKMLLESFLFIVFPVSSCSTCQMNIITDRKLHLFKSKIELPLPSPPNLYLKGLEGCRLQTTVPLS